MTEVGFVSTIIHFLQGERAVQVPYKHRLTENGSLFEEQFKPPSIKHSGAKVKKGRR